MLESSSCARSRCTSTFDMRADGDHPRITTTTIRLFLPHQVDQAARFLAENGTACQNDNNNDSSIYLTLRVDPSRVLWNTLRPLLFEAPRSVSRRAIVCLLRECFFRNDDASIGSWWQEHNQEDGQQQRVAVETTIKSTDALLNDCSFIEQRSLRVPIPSGFKSLAKAQKRRMKTVLWIQPPTTVRVEYLFAGLLIRWEHRFIQAQSLAGYIATLGGGFFLCHHFSTAIFLAEQQQRLALLLNDENMYYACVINKAYSCIYNGRFDTAMNILRQVRRTISPPPASNFNATSQHHQLPVIEKMCRSAQLFCKRMRRQSKLLSASSNNQGSSTNGQANARTVAAHQPPSATIDDYLRVRVVRDKSRKDDLVIPFSKASRRIVD